MDLVNCADACLLRCIVVLGLDIIIFLFSLFLECPWIRATIESHVKEDDDDYLMEGTRKMLYWIVYKVYVHMDCLVQGDGPQIISAWNFHVITAVHEAVHEVVITKPVKAFIIICYISSKMETHDPDLWWSGGFEWSPGPLFICTPLHPQSNNFGC